MTDDRGVRPPGEDKDVLRRRLLADRRALGADAVAAAGPALAAAVLPLCRGARVAAYAAVGSEPPTAPLLAGLAAGVLLPVLQDDGDLDWALHHSGEPLVRSARGLLEPAGPRLGRDAVGGCDVVVVPALAADRSGRRLGRGGGSYDRALRRARGLVVALLHDGELLEAVPHELHDVAVDAAALPGTGLVRLGAVPGSIPPCGTMATWTSWTT